MQRILSLILAAVVIVAVFSPAGGAAKAEDEPLKLYYEGDAQIELISPAGIRVLVDVSNPAALSAPPTENDVLLSTHRHPDHYVKAFAESFPGQQLDARAGELSAGDVQIVGIPSVHIPTHEFQEEGGSNYIFVIDIAGLRVAHFGAVGQDALTDDQLATLGEVDIAVTQFDNSASLMNLQNMKGFNLMDQVQPKLIIPTYHFSLDALAIAAERWEGFQAQEAPVLIDRSMLVEGQTRFLAMGLYAKASANLHNFPDWAAAGQSTGAAPAEGEAVTIYYEDNAQVELISPAGVRVLVDVYNPRQLSEPPTADDILLTTHTHSDHYYQAFIDSFPGQTLVVRAGELSAGDVTITGIPSAHNANDEFKEEGGTNYIFIIDMAGLRVVHFGDIGQEALTNDQLAALGTVDVAITQFDNSYSAMNLQNMKGFNLMDQVQPKLIIPTHVRLDVLEIVAEKWEGFQTQTWPIQVNRSMLVEGQTRYLAVGVYAKASVNMYSFPDWSTAAGQ